MTNGCISTDRILSKLDGYLNKNDYISAEKHLVYWLSEAQANNDLRTELLIRNELMGLYRKLGNSDEALRCADAAVEKIELMNISHQVGAATTFLNCATVYKAFGMASKAVPLFEKAREVYENELDRNDKRLGGLYNNMALALVDQGKYTLAQELYEKAISVMQSAEDGSLEIAITYLNMASAEDARLGTLEAEDAICFYLEKARVLLDSHATKDGYYAFVCEKCASVFGYYGYFLYENELKERARKIYEGA